MDQFPFNFRWNFTVQGEHYPASPPMTADGGSPPMQYPNPYQAMTSPQTHPAEANPLFAQGTAAPVAQGKIGDGHLIALLIALLTKWGLLTPGANVTITPGG